LSTIATNLSENLEVSPSQSAVLNQQSSSISNQESCISSVNLHTVNNLSAALAELTARSTSPDSNLMSGLNSEAIVIAESSSASQSIGSQTQLIQGNNNPYPSPPCNEEVLGAELATKSQVSISLESKSEQLETSQVKELLPQRAQLNSKLAENFALSKSLQRSPNKAQEAKAALFHELGSAAKREFDIFDLNGNGAISFSEMTQV
jgi:hypothetical protein